SAITRRLRPTVAGSSLTPSQISVLFTLVGRGPLRMTELASVEAINPTMLSRIAARLSEMGLIVRVPDPLDRRAALVRATAAGKRMKALIQSERTEALARHMRALPAAEREAVAAALPALEALAEQVAGRGA
ncbi:MAG TPA: MarR family transcriptional regulator, partial [Ktedonobacterales bacterium]